MTTTELPPGIYSIYVKFSTGPEYLTWLDEGVTILRPISLPKQEVMCRISDESPIVYR